MSERPRFSRIFHYYWLQIRKRKAGFLSIFVLYGIAELVIHGYVPLLYRDIIDTIAESTDRAAVAPHLFDQLIHLVVAFIALNVAYRAADLVMVRVQSVALRDLANDTFNRLQSHSYRFFTENFSGALVAKARRFVNAFETIHDRITFDFWMNGARLLVIFGVLAWIAPAIGGLFFVWMLAYFGMIAYFLPRQKRRNEVEAAEDSKVTGQLADVVTNILNVKMFSSQKRETTTFGTTTQRQFVARNRAWTYDQVVTALQGVLMGILEVGGMYLAITMWLDGTITTGTVVIMQIYFGLVFGCLWSVGKAVTRLARALSDASEMVAVFDAPAELTDPAEPRPCTIAEGDIRFDRVSFRYGEGNAIFRDFALHIAPGTRVGLVGHSGAGKSTITKLILRFADVDEGAVTIDGIDVREVRQDELREAISYVPQDPVLFHRSLKENIAYGKPDATDDEIVDAARKAHAHEFIEKLPYGYDTLVGERGVKLSGGERQRVAIARAILKDAPILILDEATSSLDSVSEKYIQQALETLMQGRTSIVIAHRLSTIQKMDRIIVLEEGRVAEEGTHRSLIDEEGIYQNLWSHQTAGFIE